MAEKTTGVNGQDVLLSLQLKKINPLTGEETLLPHIRIKTGHIPLASDAAQELLEKKAKELGVKVPKELYVAPADRIKPRTAELVKPTETRL